MALTFVTLGEDLLEHANAAADFLKNSGLKVSAEKDDGSYPVTPTLVGQNGVRYHFVEVFSSLKNLSGVERWVAFCKSRSNETCYSIVVDSLKNMKADLVAKIADLGVGLYTLDGGKFKELVSPKDLAMSLSLPPLAGEKRSVQKCLSPIYSKFDRGSWFDGFKDACQLLEDLARKRLVDRIKKAQVQFSKSGVAKVYTVAQINKQTQGQLAHTYKEIVLPDGTDVAITRILSHINKDRVGAVHKTNDAKTKARIRKNVGTHMWMLVNGIKVLL